MTSRTHKLAAIVAIAAAAALTAGATGAHPASAAATARTVDTGDNYKPANTHVSGHSSSTVFTVGPITVTCTNSTAGGTTPKTGLAAFPISPLPTFNDGSASAPCKDNVGATDSTTTSGKWTLGFIDSKTETATEPNTGDRLVVTVPTGGAVVNNTFGCVITVAPNAPFRVIGTYNDVKTFTVNIPNLPIKVTGPAGVCPLSSTTSSFKGVYTFTPGVSDTA